MEKPDKIQIVAYIHENIDSPLVRNMLYLIDAIIDETRIKNDIAPLDQVAVNQGIIQGLQQIKRSIERPLFISDARGHD